MWRPLRSTLEHNVTVIKACASLHNFCQAGCVRHPIAPPAGPGSVSLEDRPYIDGNGAPVSNLAWVAAPSLDRVPDCMHTLCRKLTAAFKEAGCKRPAKRPFGMPQV